MKKNYNNSFKFKVVIEVIRGDLTIAEVISKYQISKSVIHKWKKQFLDHGASVFSIKDSISQEEANIKKLHATIGKLKVENDFYRQAWNRVKK
jgi:transposase